MLKRPDQKRVTIEEMSEAIADEANESVTNAPAVLQGSGIGPILSKNGARARLAAISQDLDPSEWAESEMLDAEQIGARLSVDIAQIDAWRHAGQILVLGGAYPWRQFDHGRPIPGLERVLSEFDSHDTAWEFLIAENPHTGGFPPIEWLRQSHVEDVVRAAKGALDYQ